MKHHTWRALAAATLLLGGCAGDISPSGDDGASEDLPGPGGAQLQFVRDDGGWYTGTVDASGSDWIYLDLETQTQVSPSDPAASAEWDIAFLGSDIKLNGGASGAPPSGQVVVVYGDKSEAGTAYAFEDQQAAPPPSAVDYVSDEAGLLPLLPARLAMTRHPEADEAANALTGAGDHGWYHDSGRLAGSVITPRANVGYFLRTVDCRYYKLRMTAYDAAQLRFDLQEVSGSECSTGSDGEVAPLGRASFAAGSTSTQVDVDASDDSAWVYLDLAGARQVVPAAPASDAAGWDIAWRRSDIKLNGGTSGAGNVEIYAGLHDDWDARTAAPAGDYHTDEADALAFTTYPPPEGEPPSGCGGTNGDFGWYYYSGFCNDGEGMHHISPRDVVYVVRAHDGNSYKLRVLDYYDDAGSSAHPSFEYAPVAP